MKGPVAELLSLQDANSGSGQQVSAGHYLPAGLYIPDIFLRSLKMTAQRRLETISKANGIMRVPRISFDRLYIAHMRRIIATAAH